MLEGPPDVAGLKEQAAADFGLLLDLPEPEAVELWAEHLPALRIFQALRTQWVVGMNGPVGLNYAVLPVVERRLRIRSRQAREAFAHLQVLEATALQWFASKAQG